MSNKQLTSRELSTTVFSTTMLTADLFDIAQQLQRDQRRLREENRQLRHPTWTRAEPALPGDIQSTSCGCFGSSNSPSVLVYDHFKAELSVRDMATLKGKSATYEKVPSRFSKTIYLNVEDTISTMTEASMETKSKLRISGSADIPSGFRRLKMLNLQTLQRHERTAVLTGKIRWIFILDNLRTSERSRTSWERQGQNPSGAIRRFESPDEKTPSWGTDSSKTSASTQSSTPSTIPET
ncbi:MAG: hypothetical protein MMC23_001980 [Stictis urceolatum]|nr:hypothetical protein [Stictis urceolata]